MGRFLFYVTGDRSNGISIIIRRYRENAVHYRKHGYAGFRRGSCTKIRNSKDRALARLRQMESTKLLICAVVIFLICNVPGVLLTLSEIFFAKYLRKNRELHSYGRDIVNFMAIVDCSLCFFIYIVFGGQEFRLRVARLLCAGSWPMNDWCRKSFCRSTKRTLCGV